MDYGKTVYSGHELEVGPYLEVWLEFVNMQYIVIQSFSKLSHRIFTSHNVLLIEFCLADFRRALNSNCIINLKMKDE